MSDPDEYPHRLCVPSDPDTTGRNTEGVCEPGSAGQPAAQIAALMPPAPTETRAGVATTGTPPSCVERPDSTTWSPWMSVAASGGAPAAGSRDRRFCSDRQLQIGR